MLFNLTLLRERGKRLESPPVIHDDGVIKSNHDGKFMSLSVNSYYGGVSRAPGLYEAKLMKFNSDEIVFLGFETVEGRAYVQEWKLTPSKVSSTWHVVRNEEEQAHHTQRLMDA